MVRAVSLLTQELSPLSLTAEYEIQAFGVCLGLVRLVDPPSPNSALPPVS